MQRSTNDVILHKFCRSKRWLNGKNCVEMSAVERLFVLMVSLLIGKIVSGLRSSAIIGVT